MTDSTGNLNETVESITSSLLEQARKNDPVAWERIVDLYGRLVYWWCRQSGVPPDDTADVGQDVFLKLSRSTASFDRSQPGQTFRGWLRAITRTTIVDYWRTRKREPATVHGEFTAVLAPEADLESDSGPNQELLILYKQIVELVRGEFSEKDWLAFQIFTTGNCTAREVARQLDMTPNQVYLAKHRIIRRVREELGGDTQAEEPGGT